MPCQVTCHTSRLPAWASFLSAMTRVAADPGRGTPIHACPVGGADSSWRVGTFEVIAAPSKIGACQRRRSRSNNRQTGSSASGMTATNSDGIGGCERSTATKPHSHVSELTLAGLHETSTPATLSDAGYCCSDSRRRGNRAGPFALSEMQIKCSCQEPRSAILTVAWRGDRRSGDRRRPAATG